MTDQHHPITPSPELIRQWNEEAATAPMADQRYIATQAARWGADQELEACCEWLREARNHGLGYGIGRILADNLRAARRPKPLSLAEQALEQLNGIETVFKATHGGDLVDDNIRRALERLQELERND